MVGIVKASGVLLAIAFLGFCVFDAGRMTERKSITADGGCATVNRITPAAIGQPCPPLTDPTPPADLSSPGRSEGRTVPLFGQTVALAGAEPAGPDRPDIAHSRGRLCHMRVTAYCPCSKCCGRWARTPADRRFTAGGYRLADNGGLLLAADPSIPFGTIIEVPGYGRAIVADRGGAIHGGRLDVLMPTHEAALAWGVKHLDCLIRN